MRKELCLKQHPCTSPCPSNMLFWMLKPLQELSKAKQRNSCAEDAVARTPCVLHLDQTAMQSTTLSSYKFGCFIK